MDKCSDSPDVQHHVKSNPTDTTPKGRPNTRSRKISTSQLTPTSTAEKRKRNPDTDELAGNMSKKPAQETEPSNALIMRAINGMNAKMDKLPTVEHLAKLEADIHLKLERNNQALRTELRAEFKSEIQAHAERMNELVTESQAKTMQRPSSLVNRNGRNDCLLYTSPSPRDRQKSRMPSSA